MSAKIKNMTSGNPSGLILRFALPLMAGNIFQQLYTVVDTMVVGKFLGVNALAALGSSDWLNWMMLGIIQGFTQGFAIHMSQEFGAGNYERLKKVVGNSALLSLLFSIVLVVAGLLVAKPVLELLQTPAAVMPDALKYIRFLFAGVPIVMFYNLLAGILRSFGDSSTPLKAMIIASIVNIVLDVLFVYVFHWGIAGAAIATLIAQMISGLYCLYYICRIEFLTLRKKDFIPEFPLIKRLLVLGIPIAFQNAVIAIGGMILQFVINGYGVIFIAGMTATNKLYGLLEIAATSYGYAVITYVGQNLGAGKIHRIKKGMKASLFIGTLTSVAIAVFMLVMGKIIVGLFLSGTPQEVNSAMEIAYTYLTIMSVCLPILYVLHIIRAGIQGMGNTLLPMLSGIAELVMRTSGALFLPFLLGRSGLYYAEILAWIGADFVLVISYFNLMGKLSKIYTSNKFD